MASSDGDLYALEKLVEAVDALATGTGPVRARLLEAFTFLHRIRPEDIPDGELRRIFVDDVMKVFTSEHADGNEGQVVAQLHRMDDEAASTVATPHPGTTSRA